MQHARDDPGQARTAERLLAGEHAVGQDAEGEEVAPRVQGAPERLLGGHVEGRPEELPGGREMAGLDLGNAKVHDLRLSRGQDHDVGRLDVAVDHAL